MHVVVVLVVPMGVHHIATAILIDGKRERVYLRTIRDIKYYLS